MLRQVENREVIQDSQSGFIKGKSCLTNPGPSMMELTISVDKERLTDVIYLDFCKANIILLSKLARDGFDG
ncbi:hypothetical protein HGM15179_012175 [Zosterops borbonicus]|uniref:Reverse transcriptase domain-containing protein n=1 Tax=Zosterops borbonicus TaxID=364589 RepID=A0A8K1GBL3_9PASS|nr:hypothetical protein HGM15179_012175 [Zosterops borbonicus]